MSLDTSSTAEQLSTQPVAVSSRPPRLGPVAQARRAWRQLTSMRTALLLLVLLALAAVPGSLLPQRANSPSRVAQYFTQHPHLAHFFDRLGLFDTFHAPWFAAVYALLFISLTGCVIPRLRLHARALVRKPPAAPSRLRRLPQSATWHTALSPEQAVAASRDSLRRKRFRAYVDGNSVSAEKGYLRETGNLLFHSSLILLLIGVGVGSLFGYQGQQLLTSGESFVNAPLQYDAYKPGALVGAGYLSPFSVKLDHFNATYQSNGEAKTFDAYVQSTTAGGKTTLRDLRVNHPLTFGHAKVYLIGHGYALHVIVRNSAGVAKFDQTVACIPQDLTNYLSTCVIKVPDTGANVPASYTDPKTGKVYTTNADGSQYTQPLQLSALINFAPTAAFNASLGLTSVFPAPNLPRAVIAAFTGDLGLDAGAPVSVYNLDTRSLTAIAIPAAQSVITPGPNNSVPLTDGFTLSVTQVSQYATLQVKDDPAKLVVLVAAALIVLGLLGSLRVRRRRLWLRATPAAEGRTLIEVGGLARTDADDFAREFRGLVGRLADAIPPAGTTPENVTHSPEDPNAG
jgi:cytochrome c biogenesis protein